MSEWRTIDTAPKDGSRIAFKNDETGLTDVGHWRDYSDVPEWRREMWPEWLKEANGEWSTDFGNGDMTHWMPLPEQPPCA